MTRLFFATFILSVISRVAIAGEITVSAAASLTNAFKEIGQGYEKQHPGSKVVFNFGASGALLQQIAKGAPVDVLATADQETMDMAEKQGLIKAGERRDFVRNRLVLIVPANSASDMKRLDDLGQPQIKRIAVGIPASVPAGRYAKHALERARLWGSIEHKLIHTQTVRQSLDYVARGEVDAGFVYATDAALMPERVRTVLEVAMDMPIAYPIAVLAQSGNVSEARQFGRFVLSPAGQTILAKFGFIRP